MATKASLLLSLVGATAALAACAPGEVHDSELDNHLCSSETLGEGDYQELVRGNFTPRDLADLSDDASAREVAYRDAGMERGKFVYYKSVLPRPPFDPPLNIVCQAIEFETEEGARMWVEGLTADEALESLTLSSIAGADQRAHEETPLLPQREPPLRYFTASGVSDDSETRVSYLVGAEGRFVRVVGVGTKARLTHGPSELLVQLWLNRGEEP